MTFMKRPFLAVALATAVHGENYMNHEIMLNDKPMTIYLASRPWYDHVENQIEITMYKRTYLMLTDELDPYNYFSPVQLGGAVEFTLDLSQVGCGCITAFSTRVLPAVTETGELNPSTDTMYFCGAQHEAALCPEWDILEANAWSYRSTAHACDDPNEFGYFAACDHQGTGQTDV